MCPGCPTFPSDWNCEFGSVCPLQCISLLFVLKMKRCCLLQGLDRLINDRSYLLPLQRQTIITDFFGRVMMIRRHLSRLPSQARIFFSSLSWDSLAFSFASNSLLFEAFSASLPGILGVRRRDKILVIFVVFLAFHQEKKTRKWRSRPSSRAGRNCIIPIIFWLSQTAETRQWPKLMKLTQAHLDWLKLTESSREAGGEPLKSMGLFT